MQTKKSNHAWARTCSKKRSAGSKKCLAALFELKFFRSLLGLGPRGGMLCPYCGEVRYSKECRPCQVREQKQVVGNYAGCRICDHLPATTQRRLAEKVEWRYWYLMEPPAQAALENLARPAHQEPPTTKERLHHSFHTDPNQVGVGEKLASKLFKILFRPYAGEAGIQNRKAADLLEVIMEMAWNQNHYLWRQLQEFMDMVHYLELYREIIPPVGNTFFDQFLA